mmetsp:Transcript_28069/g.93205  ORF Transcript_28069/g.93205 Transcript_28069/m.93205 type:complete len:220 (+) Transcript_28069:659-1318(+)
MARATIHSGGGVVAGRPRQVPEHRKAREPHHPLGELVHLGAGPAVEPDQRRQFVNATVIGDETVRLKNLGLHTSDEGNRFAPSLEIAEPLLVGGACTQGLDVLQEGPQGIHQMWQHTTAAEPCTIDAHLHKPDFRDLLVFAEPSDIYQAPLWHRHAQGPPEHASLLRLAHEEGLVLGVADVEIKLHLCVQTALEAVEQVENAGGTRRDDLGDAVLTVLD